MFENAVWVKFPIRVVLFEKFNNKTNIVFREGKAEREMIRTNDGVIISRYFRLKGDKDNTHIPAPDLPQYQNIDGIRKLMLLKVGRNIYWPITDDGDQLVVNIPHVIYETEVKKNDKGEEETVYKRDENNLPIPMMDIVYDSDETGKIKTDKDGKKIILKMGPKIEYEQRMVFDSKVKTAGGKVIDLPALSTNENEDWETWHAMELEKAQRKYRTKNWWANNATMIIAVVSAMVMFLIFYYGTKTFTKEVSILAEALKEVAKAETAAHMATSAAGAPLV